MGVPSFLFSVLFIYRFLAKVRESVAFAAKYS